MNSKKTAIIAIAVLAIVISSLGAVSAFELFGMDLFGGPTTDFDNKFMSGTFTGDVTQNNVTEDNLTKGWTDSYEDKEHNITYNMSCVKDGNFITDVYQLQGLGAPEIRNYNGQPWKIFYSQAVPNSKMLQNLRRLVDLIGNERVIVRLPRIPDYNTDADVDASEALLRSFGITRFDRFLYRTDIDK